MSLFNFARNIVDCTRIFFTIPTNGGDKKFTKKAILNLLPIPVHLEEDSLAAVISLKDIVNIDEVYVAMDSRVEKSISVHLGEGKVLNFLECDSGLYFYDTRNDNNKNIVSYSAVQTVRENELFYTKSEIAKAKKAIRYQELIGWPSTTGIYEILN